MQVTEVALAWFLVASGLLLLAVALGFESDRHLQVMLCLSAAWALVLGAMLLAWGV